MADTPDAQPKPARKKPVQHVPTEGTRQRVRIMVAAEAPAEEIAEALGISRRSFFRHYKREIKLALTEQVGNINTRLYAIAMGASANVSRGAVRAAIYLADKYEARLRRHHGLDLGGERTFEQELAATKPTILRPDEPMPDSPVL